VRLSKNPDSLFTRGLRFRRVARVSAFSSGRDLQNESILTKLRILLERIDSVTNGKLAEVDTRVICYTICRNLHGFRPKRWVPHGSRHVLTLFSRELVQQGQKGNFGDEQCTEHGFSEVQEGVAQREDEEQREESSSDQVEKVSTSAGIKEDWPLPRDRSVLWEDIDMSSDDTAWNNDTTWSNADKAAAILHRAIVTLQDSCHSNSSLDNDTSELPGLQYPRRASIHLNSSLDHCLTKSTFYTPSP
jgi:hypothetical protein